MPYMYSEMQNKLSKIRESPLESMGQIISSRCPKGLFIRHRHRQDSLAFDVMVKGSVPTLQCLRNTFSLANCTDQSRFLNYLDQHGDHNRVLRISLARS